MKKHVLWISALALGAVDCAAPGKADKPRDQMTQREKDSAMSVSGLPGAKVIGKAMQMSDAEARRQAAIDSVLNEN